MALYHDAKESLRPELDSFDLNQRIRRHENDADRPGHHHSRVLVMSIHFFVKWAVGAVLLSVLACIITSHLFPETSIVWTTEGNLFARAIQSDGNNTFINQNCKFSAQYLFDLTY